MRWKPISHAARRARDFIISEIGWGTQHEPQIHYSQGDRRDNWLRGNPRKHMNLPAYIDCSSWASYLIWRATMADPDQDPSGWHWNAVGNSASIGAHARAAGKVVGMFAARRGDLVVWPGKHVSILAQSPHRIVQRNPRILRLGKDAHASSHGAESGPYPVTLREEIASLGQPLFVKSIPDDFKGGR